MHIYIMEEGSFIDRYILFFRLVKDKAGILKISKKDQVILDYGAAGKLLGNVIEFLLKPLPH